MHPIVLAEFRRILKVEWRGGRVLEVGASRLHPRLLDCSELDGSLKVGVDFSEAASDVRVNANHLPFKSDVFDAVVCNSVLEHDPRFWLTCQEMRRVLRPGGLLVIGVPGYVGTSGNILGEHNFPSDYYRFSKQAVQEVFFETMQPTLSVVMEPPRIIGWARKAS